MTRPMLERLLEGEGLSTVFQPIFDISGDDYAVWGVEALSRGPAGTHFELLLAHDAALRGRLRVQARPTDRLAAIAACAVAALGDAGERHIDFGELANIARHGGDVEIAEDVRQHPILGCDELVHESGHPRVIAVGELALYFCA